MMLSVGHGGYDKTKFSCVKTGLGRARSLRLLEVGGIGLKGDLALLSVTVFVHI